MKRRGGAEVDLIDQRQSGFARAWLLVPFVVAILATIGIIMLREAMAESSDATMALVRLEASVNRQLVEEEGLVNLGVVGRGNSASLFAERSSAVEAHLEELTRRSRERIALVGDLGLPRTDVALLAERYERLDLALRTQLALAEQGEFDQAWSYAYRITSEAHGALDDVIRPASAFFRTRAERARWWADGGTFAMVMIALAVFVGLRHASERDRRAYEMRLREQALHDPLTGLANRTLFRMRADHAFRSRGLSPALLYIDLDGFKHINDTYGHEVGDHVLQTIAARLETQTRGGDTVARLGGDEFAVLVEDALAEDVSNAAVRMSRIVEEPIVHRDLILSVGASIGIAEADGKTSPTELVARADAAMYENKHTRKSLQTSPLLVH